MMKWLLPEDVEIADESSPRFDERAHRPIEEPDVLNVMAFGIIEPLVAQARAAKPPLIIDGRQRTRWTVEANKRLRERGLEPIRLPVVIRHVDDDAEFLSVAVSANEIRHDDDLLTRARKAARLQQLGRRRQDIALAFGLSEAMITKYLHLLELGEPAQAAVADGLIRIHDAVGLAKLPAEEQPAAVAQMIRDRPTREALKQRGQPAKRTKADQPDLVRPTTRLRRLIELLTEQPEHFPPGADILIRWAAGTASDRQLVELFPVCSEMVKKKSRSSHLRCKSRSHPGTGNGSPAAGSAASSDVPRPSPPDA